MGSVNIYFIYDFGIGSIVLCTYLRYDLDFSLMLYSSSRLEGRHLEARFRESFGA